MKRNIFLLVFIFFAMNAHATAGHGYTININNDASISIYYLFGSGDYGPAYSEESRRDLQWSLLVWAKNARQPLANETKSIEINLGEPTGIGERITGNTYNELKNNIFSRLREFYGVTVRNDNLDSLEIFILNRFGYTDGSEIFFSKSNVETYLRTRREEILETAPWIKIENITVLQVVITRSNLFDYLREIWG